MRTLKEIETFEKVEAQLIGFYEEIAGLVKKNPHDAINRFKLKLINEILKSANLILIEKYKPFKEFIIFEDNDLPSNSDVVMILSQYLKCLENLRGDNILEEIGQWYWEVGGKITSIVTRPPHKLLKR